MSTGQGFTCCLICKDDSSLEFNNQLIQNIIKICYDTDEVKTAWISQFYINFNKISILSLMLCCKVRECVRAALVGSINSTTFSCSRNPLKEINRSSANLPIYSANFAIKSSWTSSWWRVRWTRHFRKLFQRLPSPMISHQINISSAAMPATTSSSYGPSTK